MLELRQEIRRLKEAQRPIDLDRLSTRELALLANSWEYLARPEQLRPSGASLWLFCAGRGAGKTRSAAEDTLNIAEDWGPAYRGILCSKTIADVRDVMIQGESGLVACARRRGYSINYKSNLAQVEFPHGGIAYLQSTEAPDKPRGYQSNHAWADEISSWNHAEETWTNIEHGHRLHTPDGRGPLATITTSPKPNAITRKLLRSPAYKAITAYTFGRTADNRANLAPGVVERLEALYAGTRLGRQELNGELLDTLGAIVEQDTIAQHRLRRAPELSRRIVSIDPSIQDKEDSDAAGIVVLGCDSQDPGDAYLLDDQTIEQASFSDWAARAVDAFIRWDCDCVIAEINQGGTGVVEAIRAQADARGVVVPVRSIWARASKRARAEPVGALYERGRVHHVGIFERVEKELTEWIPGAPSPNAMDALVHGVTHLLLGDRSEVGPLGAYL